MLASTCVDRQQACTRTSRKSEDRKTRSEIVADTRDGNLPVCSAVYIAANYQARDVILKFPRNRYTSGLVGSRPLVRLSTKVHVLVYEKVGVSIGLLSTKMSIFGTKSTSVVSDAQLEPPLRDGMQQG